MRQKNARSPARLALSLAGTAPYGGDSSCWQDFTSWDGLGAKPSKRDDGSGVDLGGWFRNLLPG